MPIVRSAGMSSPMGRSDGDVAMRRSVVWMDGGHQLVATSSRPAPRADAAVGMWSPHRPTQAVLGTLDRITIPQTHWIVSQGWRPTIFPDPLRRDVELGDRQRHGICASREGIKFRHRGPAAEVRYWSPPDCPLYWHLPFVGPYSTW